MRADHRLRAFPSLRVWAAAGLWLAGACAGLGALLVYGNTPGAAGAAPDALPAWAGLEPDGERFTLVMLAHPRCPCTRASLHELERLVARTGGRLQSVVLFYRPADQDEGWAHTDLWDLAARIPGTRVEDDPGGLVARHLGGDTSGHVVVYGPDGRLRFQGGITAARAHEGDNRGSDAIRSLVGTGRALEARTPVFGCAMTCAEEVR